MHASADHIWGAAQEYLRAKLSTDIYNLWFAPLRAKDQDQSNLVLEVANDFCEVWLKDNYIGLLQDAVTAASGRQLQVRFKVASQPPGFPAAAAPAKHKPLEAAPERNAVNQDLIFNPKTTFETFVVGNNNNFAYAAARAVNGGGRVREILS